MDEWVNLAIEASNGGEWFLTEPAWKWQNNIYRYDG